MTAMLLKMQMGWGETLKTSIVGLLVVIAILAVIAVLILLISKIMGAATKAFSKKKPETYPVKETAAPPAAKPAGRELPETQSQGTLQLENVDEPTAAVIMAIVSNQSGIPLNRLAFKSIKLIEEK